MSRQHCLDNFHPRVLIVKTVAPCASNVVALHRSRRLKTYRRRARTNRTNNGRGAGRPLSRQRGITFNTKFVSMSKSHVTSSWLSPPVTSCPPGVDARIPLLLQWSSKESMQEVIAWVWGSVTHGNAVDQYTWTLRVLIRTLLPEGMAFGHAKVEASCLLLHVLVACTLVELRQAFRRRKPQRWACRVARVLSVGWFDLIKNLETSLVVFLRGICSGLGPSEGGIVYGLFSKEALYVGKASVNRTHCPGLAARLTEHIRCLYRPGQPRYRLLKRRLWGVRFFPLAVFPTISQTLAAEALAISMEDPMQRMRRRTVGFDNAKVQAPRRRPPSWRWRKGRPWESIWGCSAVKEVLSNHSRCAGAGHSFFLSLHSSNTRRTCVLWVSRATLFV